MACNVREWPCLRQHLPRHHTRRDAWRGFWSREHVGLAGAAIASQLSCIRRSILGVRVSCISSTWKARPAPAGLAGLRAKTSLHDAISPAPNRANQRRVHEPMRAHTPGGDGDQGPTSAHVAALTYLQSALTASAQAALSITRQAGKPACVLTPCTHAHARCRGPSENTTTPKEYIAKRSGTRELTRAMFCSRCS